MPETGIWPSMSKRFLLSLSFISVLVFNPSFSLGSTPKVALGNNPKPGFLVCSKLLKKIEAATAELDALRASRPSAAWVEKAYPLRFIDHFMRGYSIGSVEDFIYMAKLARVSREVLELINAIVKLIERIKPNWGNSTDEHNKWYQLQQVLVAYAISFIRDTPLSLEIPQSQKQLLRFFIKVFSDKALIDSSSVVEEINSIICEQEDVMRRYKLDRSAMPAGLLDALAGTHTEKLRDIVFVVQRQTRIQGER